MNLILHCALMALVLIVVFGGIAFHIWWDTRPKKWTDEEREALFAWTRSGNLKPIKPAEVFDEEYWIKNPPPWPLNGSVGEKK